jgi:lipopolysaccharide transport system ATP-binding protein
MSSDHKMSDVVIRAEAVGKKYKITHQHERQRYVALRDVFADKMLSPWRWIKSQTTNNGNGHATSNFTSGSLPINEDFWALRDVSFEIRRGEVVGIIGRNGAGKSTLLKILSRITEPTVGRVRIRGRVASLLEVGTGFHPELTGRENIYLNGAVLGMTRAEIKQKFDEIVAFAEVEKFLDTPVKRYSSGMYVRLAFAVAAHLEPEILIVDEVLAVGDAEFQKKCLGKMDEVAKGGRTVLFVSHNLAAIRTLCKVGLLLELGKIKRHGDVYSVADYYYRSAQKPETVRLDFHYEGVKPRFIKAELSKRQYECGEVIELTTTLFSKQSEEIAIEVELHDEHGIPIAYTSTAPMAGITWRLSTDQEIQIQLQLGPIWLAVGKYRLFLWLIKPWKEDYHTVEYPLTFEIIHSDPYSAGFEFKQSYRRGALGLPIQIRSI